MSKPGGKGSKAVAGGKGAAAEGGNLQAPPGQPENIRLTVAYAERYGLIAGLSPFSPGPGGGRDRFGYPGSCALAASCSFICAIYPSYKGENDL